MIALPEAFIKRMESLLGADFPPFLASYDAAPLRALRVNTQKLRPEEFAALSPWKLAPLRGRPDAFLLAEDAPGVGKHPYHMAGLFYMQEPSAMAPVYALDPQYGTRVLDLCAAPGGKAAAIAVRLGPQGLLVANETVPGRARTLLLNLQRMGASNAVVTNMRPDALARACPGFFDAVLVDAPCSGEGMFRKDPAALRDWSEKHVAACARRQAGILESADTALRPGGRLLYSTCTFAPEENEELCASFLRAHSNYRLLHEARLYPHRGEGEGQYYALLEKTSPASGGPSPRTDRGQKSVSARSRSRKNMDAARRLAEALRALFPSLSFQAEDMLLLPDGRAFLPPPACDPAWGEGLHMLCSGLELGTLEPGGRFEPAHALFLCHGASCARKLSFPADDPALAAFLHGESIPLASGGAGKGYGSVCVDGYPLGFGRFAEGLCKNRLPKGLRH